MKQKQCLQLAQNFQDSSTKLSEILELILSSSNQVSLVERRQVLLEVMSNLARQSIGVENVDSGKIIKSYLSESNQVRYLLFGNDNDDSNNIRSNLILTRKILVDEADWRPTLASLHFRAPWLDDGRTTRAAIRLRDIKKLRNKLTKNSLVDYNGDDIEKIEQDRFYHYHSYIAIYHSYLAIYGRPFVFIEKLLNVASSKENFSSNNSIDVFTINFCCAKITTVFEKKPEFNNSLNIVKYVINITKDIFDSLTNCYTNEKQDIREIIFKIVFETFDELYNSNELKRPEWKTKLRRWMLQKLKEKIIAEKNIYQHLNEAIEMTWHQILSDLNSYSHWRDFLIELDFIQQNWSDKWTFQSRMGLLNALWFLQGVSLFEKLVPGGITTLIFPINTENTFNNQVYAAYLIGLNSQNDSETLSLFLNNSFSCIKDSLEKVMSKALTNFFSLTEPTEATSSNLETEISNQEILDKFFKKIDPIFTTPKSKETLATIFKACRILSNSIHEQQQLKFQLFIGSSNELSCFREVYIFEDNEFDRFNCSDAKNLSRLLKAHYSYFQKLNIGLFLEIEGRINPRVVETIPIRRNNSLGFLHFDEILEDDINNRHHSALNLTCKFERVIVVLFGLGKVSLYNKGEVLLRWPSNENRAWWISDLSEELWLKRTNLINFLSWVNQKFDGKLKQQEYYEIIVDALHWVSEQPGLGCSLVIAKDVEEVKKRSIPLNPTKLKWVDKISFFGASRNHIQNTLIQDGATILDICHNELYLEGQQLIAPIQDGQLYNFHLDRTRDNISLERRSAYGTRHASACDLTYVLKSECIVVTVSADGPITVFYNGDPLTPDCLEWNEFSKME